LYEAIVFLEHFKDLPDPRQRAKDAGWAFQPLYTNRPGF
jgi:hypothetical protein